MFLLFVVVVNCSYKKKNFYKTKWRMAALIIFVSPPKKEMLPLYSISSEVSLPNLLTICESIWGAEQKYVFIASPADYYQESSCQRRILKYPVNIRHTKLTITLKLKTCRQNKWEHFNMSTITELPLSLYWNESSIVWQAGIHPETKPSWADQQREQ